MQCRLLPIGRFCLDSNLLIPSLQFTQYHSVQICPDQLDHASIVDASLESVDQDVLVGPVKEFGQIKVHHHALARLNVGPRSLDRIVCPSARTKPVAVFAECGVDQGLRNTEQLHKPFQRRAQEIRMRPVKLDWRPAVVDDVQVMPGLAARKGRDGARR